MTSINNCEDVSKRQESLPEFVKSKQEKGKKIKNIKRLIKLSKYKQVKNIILIRDYNDSGLSKSFETADNSDHEMIKSENNISAFNAKHSTGFSIIELKSASKDNHPGFSYLENDALINQLFSIKDGLKPKSPVAKCHNY